MEEVFQNHKRGKISFGVASKDFHLKVVEEIFP
jgi:hypothetical protein